MASPTRKIYHSQEYKKAEAEQQEAEDRQFVRNNILYCIEGCGNDRRKLLAHLLDAQCHTSCMAQCNDLLQPMSIISAAPMTATAPAASTAVTIAEMIQAVVTTSAAAQFSSLV